MTEPITFTVRLERPEGRGTSAMMIIPIDVRAHFGRARPPVLVTIRGHTWHSTPAVYGDRYYLVVNRAAREGAGVHAGDEVEVTLAPDTAPREITVPEDLQRALDADPRAAAGFDALSYSHQREYVEWVEEARRPETRERRITKSVERARSGLAQR